jgi:hypothetical protein
MFLTRAELIDLTGYKTPKKQIAWLTKNGVRFWIAATGQPKVPVSAIDGTSKAVNDEQPFEPKYVA